MTDHDVGARVLIVQETSSVLGRIGGALLAIVIMLLGGCGPPYLSDTYATSTAKPPSLDTRDLARTPVVVLAFVAPANLQGLSPTLSHALSGALAEVTPPIREISSAETLNRLTDKGLATEYADLRAGFARNGMLDRQLLRRIGSGLGSQYVLLPGLAQFGEEILDKFEAAGIKLVRNRVTTLRLWLQLWDSQTGHIVWESSGEGTTASVLLSPTQTVALEEIARKLLVRMISGWFARIEDGNQIYRGSLSGGGPSEGSSGSCASGPAWGVRILNGAFRCIGECVARLPKPATIASTSTAAAMK